MRSRGNVAHVCLALLVVALLVAGCGPLPSLPAPTAAPPTAVVVATATPLPPDVFTPTVAPVATEALTPTVSAPITPTVALTTTAPVSPTVTAPITATVPMTATAVTTETVTAPAWAAATYQDEVGGWQIDYPETWSMIDVTPDIRQNSTGYSITLSSWQPQEPGGEGIPAGSSKIDIGVARGAAASVEAAVEARREAITSADPGASITFEEPWDLPGGLTGTHWTIETGRGEIVHELVAAINGNQVVISGMGDAALFEQIASTLRGVGTETGAANKVMAPVVASGGAASEGAALAGAASGGAAAGSAEATTALAATTYTVRAGDTLAKIAARFGISVNALLAANPQITNPDRIFIGQRLVIPTAGGNQPPPPPAGTTRVNIYMIGEGGGNVGCGDQVVAVRRDVPRTAAPLTAALNLLLSQKSQYYGESGLYNALYQSDLRIASITRSGSAWTINLTGILRLGGVCDNPRVKAQLEQTALQFSTVKSVRYFVNGTALDTLLSGR